MTDFLQALSVRQPWAWLIIRGHKDVENREWETRVRGWVLLHASGKKPAKWDWAASSMFAAKRGVEVPPHGAVPLGVFVGAMRIDDCVTQSASPWFTGRFGFVIGCVHPFETPIAAPGALGFFRVPPFGGGVGGLELKIEIEKQIAAIGLTREFRL
jgi:hypothetical protein